MPIVDIEVVGQLEAPESELARAAADGLGRLFASDTAQTWVRLRTLPLAAYAENGIASSRRSSAVFVSVLKRSLPERAALKSEAGRVAQVVAAIFGRPVERVHVLYEPPGAGRIAFGGNLVE